MKKHRPIGLPRYFHWPQKEWGELLPRNFRGAFRIFSSLKTRNFRFYFLGQCVSLCGTWIQNIAMGWLIYRMTDSVFLLTSVTFLNLIPSLVLTPLTGVLSDRFNRYKILLTTQSLFMLQAMTLAVLTLGGWIEVWHILALSACAGIFSAVEAPARQSFYTSLVRPEDMSNAIALNSVAINGSRFVGPPIGGILISLMGEGYCFLLNSLSYLGVLTALLLMVLPPFVRSNGHSHWVREFREGLSYINGYLPIKTVILLVAAACFFGMPFLSIVPAVVRDVLGGDSQMLGYVMSSIGAGAMTAGLYLAARKRVRGLGKVVTICCSMFGVGLVLLSFVHIPVLACMVCFPIGFGMIATLASCNTLLQTLVDDDKRGRVMSFFTMASAGMNPLGSLFMGSVAKTVGINNVLWGSGLLCIASAALYEYYRPIIRRLARNPRARGKVIPEIAVGIDQSQNNPF